MQAYNFVCSPNLFFRRDSLTCRYSGLSCYCLSKHILWNTLLTCHNACPSQYVSSIFCSETTCRFFFTPSAIHGLLLKSTKISADVDYKSEYRLYSETRVIKRWSARDRIHTRSTLACTVRYECILPSLLQSGLAQEFLAPQADFSLIAPPQY